MSIGFILCFALMGGAIYLGLYNKSDLENNPIYKKIGVVVLVICLCIGFVLDYNAPKDVEYSREYYEQREKKAKDFYDFYDAYEKAKSNY